MTLIRGAVICAGLLSFGVADVVGQTPGAVRAEANGSTSPGAGAIHRGGVQSLPRRPISADSPIPVETTQDDPFAGLAELPLERLIEEVLSRNPSLQAAVAAWQAAAQRYPQVVSLEDPMFAFMLGPGAWGSEFDGAYMLELSQKLPWPGKRDLRGAVARAEASAMEFEVGDTELMLVEAAKMAFYDYYLSRRLIELNRENTQILGEFRETASAKYRANLVPQQDVLQAEVELADLTRRQFELERTEQVAVARINTLLHRTANHPLPAPPRGLQPGSVVPDMDQLQQIALARRPDLAAVGARIRAEQNNLYLANREYFPDVEIVGRYDAFWQEDPLRAAVGLNLNLPIYQRKRRAAVCEAMYRLNQQRWEFENRIAAIRNNVQSSYAWLLESQRTRQLYQTTLLPLARQNVESAKAGYITASVDFLRVIEAQRQFILLQEKYFESDAQYHRQLAELERNIAGPLEGNREVEELPRPVP